MVLLPQVPRERRRREDGRQVRVQAQRRQAARAVQDEHHQEEEEDAQRRRGQRGTNSECDFLQVVSADCTKPLLTSNIGHVKVH